MNEIRDRLAKKELLKHFHILHFYILLCSKEKYWVKSK